MQEERWERGPGNISESETVSGGLILQQSHHLQTPQVQDLLHWRYDPCLQGERERFYIAIRKRGHRMCTIPS